MGNLGRYQEIVELAKQSGGVDNLIGKIQRGAVADAAPKLLGAGVVTGAALTYCLPRGYKWFQQVAGGRRGAIQAGDSAKNELCALLEESTAEPWEAATGSLKLESNETDVESPLGPDAHIDVGSDEIANRTLPPHESSRESSRF